MKIFKQGYVQSSTKEEYNEVLNQDVFNTTLSIWQAESFYSKKTLRNEKAFKFLNTRKLNEIIASIVKPENTPEEVKLLVEWAKAGDLDAKLRLPAFTVSTFHPSEDGRIRRVGKQCDSFSKLIQYDLDLKNEPICNAEYVQWVQDRLFQTKIAPYILLCGKSISSKGLYFFINTDSDDEQKLTILYEKIYKLLQHEFRFQHDKTIDPSSKDFKTRLRYYAPDIELIINADVQTLPASNIQVPEKVKFAHPPQQLPQTLHEEVNIIKKWRTKFLKEYSTSEYQTGFHELFSKKFIPACLNEGVEIPTLKIFTEKVYGNLLHKDGRSMYFSELERILEYWEKKFKKK